MLKPTTTLSPVMMTAARTELPAAARFSARINLEEGMAGFPDMQELSPLREKSAKQIAASIRVVREWKPTFQPILGGLRKPTDGEELPLVLGFGSWHFSTF